MDSRIMSEASADVTVDVRDMLCAQALALLAQSVDRLPIGRRAAILYTTDDVKLDVIIWARERGFIVSERSPGILRLERVR